MLDLMDFIEEKIREGLESEPSQAAAIGEAALLGKSSPFRPVE